MASSSTAAAFVVALRGQLQVRPALAGVDVHLIAPIDLNQSEFILLLRGRIEGTQEYAAIGRFRREDRYSIPCLIRVRKTNDGAGGQEENAVFQAAMDRAADLLQEVIMQLRDSPPSVGNQTIIAQVEQIVYVPMLAEPKGWAVDCEFSVSYRARVS